MIDQSHNNVYVHLFEIVIILLQYLNVHEVNDHQPVEKFVLNIIFHHLIVDEYSAEIYYVNMHKIIIDIIKEKNLMIVMNKFLKNRRIYLIIEIVFEEKIGLNFHIGLENNVMLIKKFVPMMYDELFDIDNKELNQ